MSEAYSPYFRQSLPALRKFAHYLKTHGAVQDSLSIFVTRAEEGFALGDVRQMIRDKVDRVAHATNTSSTDVMMDRVSEVADDFIWLMKTVRSFNSDGEDGYIFLLPHIFPNDKKLILALSAARDTLLSEFFAPLPND